MSEVQLTPWECVQHINFPPVGFSPEQVKALEDAIESANSFSIWPRINRHAVKLSLAEGEKLGHVSAGAIESVVGKIIDHGSHLELRAKWSPPA